MDLDLTLVSIAKGREPNWPAAENTLTALSAADALYVAETDEDGALGRRARPPKRRTRR